MHTYLIISLIFSSVLDYYKLANKKHNDGWKWIHLTVSQITPRLWMVDDEFQIKVKHLDSFSSKWKNHHHGISIWVDNNLSAIIVDTYTKQFLLEFPIQSAMKSSKSLLIPSFLNPVVLNSKYQLLNTWNLILKILYRKLTKILRYY